MTEPSDEETAPTIGGPQDGAADPVRTFTAMQASAFALHELFLVYCTAGFSESQSTYLLGVLLAESLRKAP